MGVYAHILKDTLNEASGNASCAACLYSAQQQKKQNASLCKRKGPNPPNQTQLTDLCSCHARCEVMHVHCVPVYSNFSCIHC